MTFARTKIQAPQPRATFVARSALHDNLARALHTRRLVLVCAPAGFGKTTALANEVTALSAGHALAWISADPGDDLHRLLECMLTALEPYDLPWRTAPEALVARAPDIDRTLFDYLVVEVVDRLRPELRDFLSHVSVLPELVPERCAVVSDNPHAARLLDEIERLGLFVDVMNAADEVDDGEPEQSAHRPIPPASAFVASPAQRALRLHDLLRDALQRRLELNQPALLVQMRERAAASEPDPIRRVALLLAAGNRDEAARLVARHGPAMLADGSSSTVMHLLRSFDPAFCRESPELQYVTGLAAWYHWDFAAMLAAMARAEAAYGARGDAENEGFARAYRASAQVALGRLGEGGPVLEAMHVLDLSVATRIVVLARAFDLSLHTVKRHVAHILDKLQLESRGQGGRVVSGARDVVRTLGRSWVILLTAQDGSTVRNYVVSVTRAAALVVVVQPATTVVEYVNVLDFRIRPVGTSSTRPIRPSRLRSMAARPANFFRTGRQFFTGRTAQVCRFYGSVSPGPNSHFFTVDAAECAGLRDAKIKPTPGNVQQWNSEGFSYNTKPATSAANGVRSCPANTLPLYRAYNNVFPLSGPKNPWDSNHRFTPMLVAIAAMVALGWRDEGVVFCTAE